MRGQMLCTRPSGTLKTHMRGVSTGSASVTHKRQRRRPLPPLPPRHRHRRRRPSGSLPLLSGSALLRPRAMSSSRRGKRRMRSTILNPRSAFRCATRRRQQRLAPPSSGRKSWKAQALLLLPCAVRRRSRPHPPPTTSTRRRWSLPLQRVRGSSIVAPHARPSPTWTLHVPLAQSRARWVVVPLLFSQATCLTNPSHPHPQPQPHPTAITKACRKRGQKDEGRHCQDGFQVFNDPRTCGQRSRRQHGQDAG